MLKKTLMVFFVLCTFQVFAQKNFEGKITYSLYPIDDSAQKRTMVIYLKADKIFLENSSNNFYTTNSLFDFRLARRYDFVEDSVVTYCKLQRNIFPYVKMEADTINAFITIAGYRCKKKLLQSTLQ